MKPHVIKLINIILNLILNAVHASKEIVNRYVLILARVIDHRVGQDDYDAPDIPILTQY